MTAVIQRVSGCRVVINGKTRCETKRGLLILLGISVTDTEADIGKLVKKCEGLRIFEDENGKMNLSANDIGAEIVLVPNFTLCADSRRGKRPSFTPAMPPDKARPMFEAFAAQLSKTSKVVTGVFGADMKITLTNDGPVTLVLRSEEL